MPHGLLAARLAVLAALLLASPGRAVDAERTPAAADAAATDRDPPRAVALEAADLDLARYRGRVVYLDFWASWCGPCVKSFPWLADLQERRRDEGLVVVAINLDRERAAAERFLRKHPVPFPIVYDPEGKLATAWDIEVMPTSFLLDRDGKPRHDHRGFREADVSRIEAEIEALLKEPPVEERRP